MKPQELHKAFSALLSEKLRPFTRQGKKLNLVTCTEIYTTIFETLVEVITESGTEVTNEGMNYLAQQYYDGVLITGEGATYELDPYIFTQRAKMENITTEELTLLAVMLGGTDFAVPIIEEIRKRG